jgi:hypothetical protein
MRHLLDDITPVFLLRSFSLNFLFFTFESLTQKRLVFLICAENSVEITVVDQDHFETHPDRTFKFETALDPVLDHTVLYKVQKLSYILSLNHWC